MSASKPATDEHAEYDRAVGILLDSPLLSIDHTVAFWQFCDGEITEDELRDRLR